MPPESIEYKEREKSNLSHCTYLGATGSRLEAIPSWHPFNYE